MFRALATTLPDAGKQSADDVLTKLRPSLASEYLERFWNSPRNPAFLKAIGIDTDTDILSTSSGTPAARHQAMARRKFIDPLSNGSSCPTPDLTVQWHHLVYAALLQQTRIVEIFRQIVFEALHGERLPKVSQSTQRWLHTTEQLFFGYGWPYSVQSVTSTIRPDREAVRRNAYWRMFGWDLQHGTEDGRPYPYVKADAANKAFTALFDSLVFETWRGYINRDNDSGANETDDTAITELVRHLREMLTARRHEGTLSREEFDAVATLSWFHLTVEFDTVVVRDFNAQGGGEADRLKQLGERVGIPAHSRSDAFFQLAQPMSTVLRAIETDSIAAASDLYDDGGLFQEDMLKIITHWSIATGRSVKDLAARPPVGYVLTAAARAEPVELAGRERLPVLAR
jgi:hypothetical protein